MKREAPAADVPLVVDLDGTLCSTDLLVESTLRLLKRNPLLVFLLPLWLLRGKHVLKAEVARRVRLDAALLPCNEEFVAYLREQRSAGRPIVLATASTRALATQVFEHFRPLFDELMCSTDTVNLKGPRKRDAIVQRWGDGGFDYAGNDAADLAVWRSARKAVVVNPSWRVRGNALLAGKVERTFERASPLWRVLLRSLRIHQWLKNLLVFVPLLAAHKWTEPALLHAVWGFAALCLMASGVYQVNDILDVDHDRAHPNKRRRPIASGELSIPLACATAAALLAAGLVLAYLLSPAVLEVLVAYAVLTTAYSLWLKALPMIDVVVLAFLYTIRIVFGAAAIAVVPSYWLLTFSMFMFLSLAILKRCAELASNAAAGTDAPAGRGYRVGDLPTLTSLGTALGAMAVLVLALYINADASARIYTRPALLWLLCPVLVYWLGHVWLKTGRGEMHDDPIIFAVRDRASIATAAVGVALVIVASI